MSTSPFEMGISLNVLNHLGLNLYSNVPAVLSELVANSWDAGATKVEVFFNTAGEVRIKDNGVGMNQSDINDRYLNVGYDRRLAGMARSEIGDRPVMGRK